MHFSRGCFKWYFQNIIIPFLFSGNLNISNWPQTWKFSQLLQARKTVVAFDFSRHGHTLVMLSVQFLCSDWSKFTGEFMRKIYAASWILFTLTAEADRVLCQPLMFFSTGRTKWNSAAIRSLLLFMASLFIGFLVEKYMACQRRKSNFGWHCFCFHLAWCVRGLQGLKRYWPYLIPFRSCTSNGKPE